MPTGYWLTFGNSTCGFNGKGVGWEPPIVLPPYTIRLKFTEGVTPTFSKGTGTQVSSSPNVWDLTYADTNWGHLLYDQRELLEVVAANTTGVTNMRGMLENCYSLTSVSLFDTATVTDMMSLFSNCKRLVSLPALNTANVTNMMSLLSGCSRLTSLPALNTANVTNMSYMLYECFSLVSVPALNTANVTTMASMLDGCSSLVSVPALSTASVTYMDSTFRNCTSVQSGALALYQQASTQATPPPSHSGCFSGCGLNAPSDAPIHAEMRQIPMSWGGYRL